VMLVSSGVTTAAAHVDTLMPRMIGFTVREEFRLIKVDGLQAEGTTDRSRSLDKVDRKQTVLVSQQPMPALTFLRSTRSATVRPTDGAETGQSLEHRRLEPSARKP
jgi:hypothetical protein